MKTTWPVLVVVLVGGFLLLPGCKEEGEGSDASSNADEAAVALPDLHVSQDIAAGDENGGVDERFQPEQAGGEGLSSCPRPHGTKELGEECASDCECGSGLCWNTSEVSGCTVECNSHVQCQELGGLLCVTIRKDLSACVVPPPVGTQCANHQACLYPTVCLEEFNWCDLPECTFDRDCPTGESCEPGVRKCEPQECKSNHECANPTEFCMDGQCGPPQCKTRADCEPGNICSYAQGICTDATPCNEEGKCSFYNQLCVDGLCEPNLCATPCAGAAEQCNPKTGKCGPTCATPQDCPPRMGCDQGAGICYENRLPVAVPSVKVEGQLEPAADLEAGATAELDGSLSFDPEGFALAWSWMLLAKPPAAPENTGTIFCQKTACTLGPLAPGSYLVGLWVTDPIGGVSMQGMTAVFAK